MYFSFSRYLYLTLPRYQTGKSNPLVEAAFRGTVAPSARPGGTEVDYHADVQRELIAGLRRSGAKVEENVRLFAPKDKTNSSNWTYDADYLARTVADPTQPTFICEVKTSLTKESYDEFDGSEYRRKQFQVLVLASLGGHVRTVNPRASAVGLPVGTPFPPLPILVTYAIPLQPYAFKFIPAGDLAGVMSSFAPGP